LFHGAGYSGHGVSLANYAGKILAPAVLQRLGIDARPLAPPMPFGRLPFKLPPRPLTYAGMQAYRFALNAQDRWEKA
jgi:glycine/D-amino acid oxidase-like deaminating enzyme